MLTDDLFATALLLDAATQFAQPKGAAMPDRNHIIVKIQGGRLHYQRSTDDWRVRLRVSFEVADLDAAAKFRGFIQLFDAAPTDGAREFWAAAEQAIFDSNNQTQRDRRTIAQAAVADTLAAKGKP